MNLLDPLDPQPEEDWVCNCLAASPSLFQGWIRLFQLCQYCCGLVAFPSWMSLCIGSACVGGCKCWQIDFKPFFVSQSASGSPFCNGSGPCSLAVLSVLSWGGTGQTGSKPSPLYYAGQTPSHWHDCHHLLSVEMASLKLVIFNQSSSAEVPWVLEACQGWEAG